MQSYPGGIQSGTDWYQNDLGVVLTETTIDQSPFNMQGTPVAYRARHAIQYGDIVDKVVELLKTRNNGLYTNEWIIGDARTNEIAMLELGTYKTRLYRSSKEDWFGGTEGFYWGCNNAKDLDVRLEYAPDPHGAPQDLPFVPAIRDVKWQQMYREHKGSIDESFAFLAFRTAPLVSASTMDAKVTTSEMASKMMTWALFGKPNQREWVPSAREEYAANTGLYSSGYKLFQANPDATVKPLLTGAPAASVIEVSADQGGSGRGRGGRRRAAAAASKDYLWKGWILPASDSDVWLTAGSAAYFDALSGNDVERELDQYRADFRAATVDHDTPLAQIKSSTTSANWHTIAQSKGVLLVDALRRSMGDDAFYGLMRDFLQQEYGESGACGGFRRGTQRRAADSGGEMAEWNRAAGRAGGSGLYGECDSASAGVGDFGLWDAGRSGRQSVCGRAVAEAAAESVRTLRADLQGFRGFGGRPARS